MAEDRRINFDRVLAAIVIGLLLVATAVTLRPFFPAILWSIVLAISAAPMHGRIAGSMPQRPRLAATLTSLALVLILIVPALGLTRAVITYTPGIIAWVDSVATAPLNRAPASLNNLPLIGEVLSRNWEIVASHLSAYIAHFKQDIEEWLLWGLQEMETVGVFVFEFALAVVLAGVFLAHQDRLSGFAHLFFTRIGGPLGVELLDKSVQTTRSTVRGVVGSAVAEAVVAMFAYFIAGVPAWLVLGGLTFFAALIQIGAPLVWIPVAGWLLVNDQPGWAIFIVAWGIIVINAVENLSRPYLVSRASHLPGLLIFIGVLGGLLAWGLIGVFLGPVILAVAYELAQVWFSSSSSETAVPASVTEAPAPATTRSTKRPRAPKGRPTS
jgi:predicted PurR-regulated permease PerM